MNSLENMSLEELWRLFPVMLVKHDNRWTDIAKEEIKRLHSGLRLKAIKIHHIGSTAVRDIMAKPIVDLLVEVPENVKFESLKKTIIDLGYICMSETAERLSFNRGYTVKGYAKEVFHLHLRHPNDNDEIYFCEYLNRYPEVAKEYEALKNILAEKYKYNRDAYTMSKTSFVNRYTELGKQCKMQDS